jgi:hypothetical protein
VGSARCAVWPSRQCSSRSSISTECLEEQAYTCSARAATAEEETAVGMRSIQCSGESLQAVIIIDFIFSDSILCSFCVCGHCVSSYFA